MKNIFTPVRCFVILLISITGMLNGTVLYGQSSTVSGIVSGESGDALPGVNIIVKGDGRGLVTDITGKYSIDNLTAADVLTFSFIGYNTVEVVVGKKTTLNISLTPDVKNTFRGNCCGVWYPAKNGNIRRDCFC